MHDDRSAWRPRILTVTAMLFALIFTSVALPAGGVGQRNRIERTFQFVKGVQRLTDVKQLEALALRTDDDFASELAIDNSPAAGASARIDAYARLGELGTPESLDAVRRIEAAAKQWPAAPETVSRTFSPHPGWHMGTGPFKPIAETTGRDGVHYGIVVVSYFGPWNAFLVSNRAGDDRSWTRPKLIPRSIFPNATDAQLTWQTSDRLVFTFTQGLPRGYAVATEAIGPQRWTLSIADITRDSDGDGWTDYEEAVLGLDAHKADTDGDGLVDGRDPAPAYRAPETDADDERVAVLQKAFFAAFGLTHARYLLFVRSTGASFQPWGYQGPILFGHDIPDLKRLRTVGGVYVDWKIVKMTETEAEVALSDYEGLLAAGGQDVLLRKIGAEWFVVTRSTTWVS